MRKRVAAMLCALLLFLSGCSVALPWAETESTGEGETITVYRLAEDGTAGELTGQELCPVPKDAPSQIDAALALFAAPSSTGGLRCALPEGVTVESWTEENGAVTVVFSNGFLDLGGMDRTAAAFCAALTLCALQDVESVTVISGGRTLFSNLVDADALLRDTDTDPLVRQLRLYFADGAGRYLVSEYRSLTLEPDASPDRYVMEELLRGPNSGELESAIPAGTELLSCRTEDGVCTVDLSAEFYEGRPQTALGERLAVYSIVNSLTALSQVDGVVLLVEGKPVERYVYRPLDEPLVRYEQAIGPVSSERKEADVDLYLPLPGLEHIAPLPWRISPEDYESAPQAVVSALLAAAEPGYPILFSGSGTVGSVMLRGDSCTVDLSESFFASLPVEARAAAIQSIAASLCGLDQVERVFFSIGGGPALFDGVDWSGPWSWERFDLIE